MCQCNREVEEEEDPRMSTVYARSFVLLIDLNAAAREREREGAAMRVSECRAYTALAAMPHPSFLTSSRRKKIVFYVISNSCHFSF